VKKNRLKFKKKRPVWFGFSFISLKLQKTNRTEPKSKKKRNNQAKPKTNRAKPKKPSQTGLNHFLSKNEPNRIEIG
jgi:hypothetical protein